MSEPDKYKSLIGYSLAAHVSELLELLREDKAYTLIVDNGQPQLTFQVAAVRRAIDHIEQAWDDIHTASAPKAAVLPFRKLSPAEYRNLVEVK